MAKFKRVPSCTAVVCAVLIAAMDGRAQAAGRGDPVAESLAAQRPYVTGELLVQWQVGTTPQQKQAALGRVGGAVLERVLAAGARADRRGDLELVSVPAGIPIATALGALGQERGVEFAEPNWTYQHTATSNDPYFTSGQLWGQYGNASSPANRYGSQAAEAWAVDHTCSDTVYVGVIDEGVMDTHEDLAGNVWTNPYDPIDGIDNDGNGYADDTHGWDFDGRDSSTFDGISDDHGTHVAGTIAGVGGNGKGVAGVCWNAKLISAKFLGRRGGTTANAIKAVNYITDLKTRHGLNIVATNNSWGGGGFSQALRDAIATAGDAGILFVAAAGNSGEDNDVSPHYPSSYDNPTIVSVASITSAGALSSFSNYGLLSVDLGAPGSGIVSTVPVRSGLRVVSGYATYSGTSMATPHVAGAAALYASTHPGVTPLQLKQVLLASALPTASLVGKTVSGARLNAGGY